MSTEETALPEHSKLFSPSSYKFNRTCPARPVLSLQVAGQEATEAMKRGTVMHDVSDKILKVLFKSDMTPAKKKKTVKALLRTIPGEYETLKDDEEREIVMHYVTKVKEIRNKVMGQVNGEYTEYFESRLTDGKDSSGTVDYGLVIITKKKKAYLVTQDLKTGEMDVDAEENPQLGRYALLLAAQLPEDVALVSAHLVIHQPRTDKEPKVWKASAKYLEGFKKEFLEHKKLIYKYMKEGIPDDAYNVTDDCKYCDALGICPAQIARREKEMGLLMQDQTALKAPDIATIPLARRIAIAHNEKLIEKFVKAVKQSVIDEGIAGADLGDKKVVGSHQKRGWRKDMTVADIAKKLRDMGAKSVTKSSLISIGDVEKMIGKEKHLLAGLTQLSKSNPCLAKKSDNREPWKTGIDDTMLD